MFAIIWAQRVLIKNKKFSVFFFLFADCTCSPVVEMNWAEPGFPSHLLEVCAVLQDVTWLSAQPDHTVRKQWGLSSAFVTCAGWVCCVPSSSLKIMLFSLAEGAPVTFFKLGHPGSFNQCFLSVQDGMAVLLLPVRLISLMFGAEWKSASMPEPANSRPLFVCKLYELNRFRMLHLGAPTWSWDFHLFFFFFFPEAFMFKTLRWQPLIGRKILNNRYKTYWCFTGWNVSKYPQDVIT